jgi:Mg2+-importing ATPase
LLLFLLQATPEQFRTGWFVESLMTELVVALVVRTRRPFFKSKPGRSLWVSTLTVALVTVLIPYMPFSGWMGFTPLAPFVMTVLILITVFYVAANEVTKKVFYARIAT